MRDINRIDELLKLLEMVWKQESNRDLRLGQLLDNIASEKNQDVFYLEDDVVIEWLKGELNKEKEKKTALKDLLMKDIKLDEKGRVLILKDDEWIKETEWDEF